MIEKPEIVNTEALTIAKIHQVVPMDQIRKVMGKTLQELRSAIEEQGLTVTGPWFTHHLTPPADNFDFEVCFPVSDRVRPTGRVQPGEWPAMTVVRTVYRGAYEGLPAAWAEFMKWINTHRHGVRPDLWERYITGPETGSDPSMWQTELNRAFATP